MFDIKKQDILNCKKLWKNYHKNKKFLKDNPVIPGKYLFVSFNGRKCDCNPLAIYNYLIRNRKVKPEDCTWVIYGLYSEKGMKNYKEGILDENAWKEFRETGVYYPGVKPSNFPAGTKLVIHYSDEYIKAVMTSEVIITNNAIEPTIPIRKNQIVIGTWHAGSCLKTFGNDNLEERRIDNIYQLKMKGKQYTHFLANNDAIAKVIPHALFVKKSKVVRVGQARCAVLFNKNNDRMKIREELGIPEDKVAVLYAPTFRSSRRFNVKKVDNLINFYNVGKAITQRFGKNPIYLFRTHYFDKMTKINESKNIIDVSNYPRVMDLIIASDILITDYSSIQWDFAITKKPGFLYVPDLKDYTEHRNFYTDINDWAYPHYTNQEGLIQGIKDYDVISAEERIREHFYYLNSYESPNSCEKLYKIIKNDLDKLHGVK